jgi:hypothetical protein
VELGWRRAQPLLPDGTAQTRPCARPLPSLLPAELATEAQIEADGLAESAAEDPAQPVALAPPAAEDVAEHTANEDDEWLELPEAQHVLKVPDFAPELVRELRAHYDERWAAARLRQLADATCVPVLKGGTVLPSQAP